MCKVTFFCSYIQMDEYAKRELLLWFILRRGACVWYVKNMERNVLDGYSLHVYRILYHESYFTSTFVASPLIFTMYIPGCPMLYCCWPLL